MDATHRTNETQASFVLALAPCDPVAPQQKYNTVHSDIHNHVVAVYKSDGSTYDSLTPSSRGDSDASATVTVSPVRIDADVPDVSTGTRPPSSSVPANDGCWGVGGCIGGGGGGG